MLLFSRGSWRDHRPWCFLVVLAFLLALGWFAVASWGERDWPSGSSWPGLTFGVVGGLIILFEGFLWVRKRFLRVWRIGRTQSWLRAHIWLGLLCGPILLLHSGFRWGGPLATVLSLLLIAVILSGIWGLVLQNKLPRMMLEEVPAETIYSQMDYLSRELAGDARKLVRAVCGSTAGDEAGASATAEVDPGPLVVGAVRSAGRVTGKVLTTFTPMEPVADSEALQVFFDDHLQPYLLRGRASGSDLALESHAQRMFADLRTKLPPPAHQVLDSLEGFCTQRRQWDYQAWLHVLLHCWLVVHFAASVALIVLMGLHIVVALKYW